MNIETAKRLCKITEDFYQAQSDSFSETRKAPWTGWSRCLEVLKAEWAQANATKADAAQAGGAKDDAAQAGGTISPPKLSVFDLACGNLRFELFLKSALVDTKLICYAVDNCDDLLPSSLLNNPELANVLSLHYQKLDVIQEMLEGKNISELFDAPKCDVAVSFGFMHHVPTFELRKIVLLALVDQVSPGGYVAVSFWQFLNNASMASKAQKTHEKALLEHQIEQLDEGDYLLGWKKIPGVYRYCHHFSDSEIDELLCSVSDRAQLVSRFVSDGRTDNLNTYLLLKVF